MTIYDILFSHRIDAENEMLAKENPRFVHYTSAETAMHIIQDKKIWMRNTALMNDYAEIRHGETAVRKFFNLESITGKNFWNPLEKKFPKIFEEVDSYYTDWDEDLKRNTFVTSVSVHNNDEDLHGRLSMWRAYGNNTGVALVIKPNTLFSENSKLQAFSYPALYWSDNRIRDEFTNISIKVRSHLKNFNDSDRNDVRYWLQEMLHSFAISLKHPGFKEEQEWRVVYRPNNTPSGVITESIKSVRGIPQKVHEIPLEEDYDTALPQLLDRVIIGPSEQSFELKDAFVELLLKAGIQNADSKVFVSGIPLR